MEFNINELMESNFKWKVRTQIDIALEEEFKKLNMWGYCKQNNKYGILDEYNNWHSLYNRANTNSSFIEYIMFEMMDKNHNIFKNINNPLYFRSYSEKIGQFIKENFRTYFTNDNPQKFNKVKSILKQSWFNGNITLIISIESIKRTFSNIKEIKYGFNVGDNDDFNGIDVKLILDNDNVKTFQVKSGRVISETDDYCKIKGSVNGLDYDNCDYYIYSNVKWNSYETSSVIFKNIPNIEKINRILKIKKSFILFNETFEMKLAETINEISTLSLKNGMDVTLTNTEEKNYIIISENNININLVDFNDESFIDELNESLVKLKKQFLF